MKRSIHRLSMRTVETKRKPGLYADGGGLYLQVGPSGSKAWLFRFMLRGRAREMGLGSINARTLQEARDEALACRKQLLQGVDPIEARNAKDAQERLNAAKAITFRECAAAYIEAHRAGWKNGKHVEQWRNTLDTYAGPTIGNLPVQGVDTGLVLRVLEPIWKDKPETASRVRGRVEAVLDWAGARGFRVGENPARWRGHLDKLLPKRSKVRRVKHHAALPYLDIAAFVAKLREQPGIAARALDFAIITATRTQEVIGAQWDEFDLARETWTIPAGRMKAQREHRVPLPDQAVKIIEEMRKAKQSDYVFPGAHDDEPLSNAAMLALLKRRMGRADLTVHGFRSTFRDWTAEQSNFPREVAEAALAHVLSDKTEAAYQRGDLFEKRRKLMQAWADYVNHTRAEGKVRQLAKAAA
jgi:integrase